MRWMTAASLALLMTAPVALAASLAPPEGGDPGAMHGCGDIAPLHYRCAIGHAGYQVVEPKPTVETKLLAGTVISVVQGQYGATTIYACDFPIGYCGLLRDDYMQPGEQWVLRCSAHNLGARSESDADGGIGNFACGHSGG